MEIAPSLLVVIGIVLAAWTLLAAWLVLQASTRARSADAARRANRRMGRIMNQSPAVPMLVRADGRIEAAERLASWLGLPHMPEFLSELDDGENGLSADQLQGLTKAIGRAQKSSANFSMTLTPPGSKRSLALRGAPADPQVAPTGAALVWWFDFSESADELTRLSAEAQRARGDFAALVGLIEAAPMPMWFRDTFAKLQLVNTAYVEAVGGDNARQVVADQIELIEAVDGANAAQIASQALAQDAPVERIVSVTIDGQRRRFRVSDLPLGDEGVAGYAIDIEEMEEQARAFRAFREAQRSMLDQLSVGVAQFDSKHAMVFANQPFQRIFALPGTLMAEGLDFDRFLDSARDAGRLPEVRDFPLLRRELNGWFAAGEVREDAWPLRDGTHLRIVAQPMPDGSLVLIAEDQTEQLSISAMRDTLLRTRTATFDSLFEALAVFAPDGKLQLWNRRFAAEWRLDEDFLDDHPRIEALLNKIGEKLARPKQVAMIGDVVRAATLDREQRSDQVKLADGRIVEFAGVPLPDGNGLLTVLDITDSKKAEEALRERATALEEADAVKTKFLSNMSYEFRTPLTSIGGFAELLQAGVAGELSDQGQEYVAAILSSVERLSGQIESVLDMTQSEAGLLPIETEEVDLLNFVTRVVRERESTLDGKGQTLDLRGDKSAGKIQADRRRLSRALGNIVDNAIEATPQGGRILVALRRTRKGGAEIIVSDNGAGMTQAELARALDGYLAQEGAGEGRRRKSLGLPLARELIEAHGGTLTLVSEKGAGTTATIALP